MFTKVHKRKLIMLIIALVTFTALSISLIGIFDSIATAGQLYSKLRFKSKTWVIIRPIKFSDLLENAKSLNVSTRILNKSELLQICTKNKEVLKIVEKLGGFNKISTAQLTDYRNRSLLILFINSNNKPIPIVIDLVTGEKLPAKLILIRQYSEKIPIIASVSTEAMRYVMMPLEILRLSGVVSISDQIIHRVIATYLQLRAYKEVNVTSYKLIVKIRNKPHYVILGYYINAETCESWVLSGCVVYRICAGGIFYVNPYREIKLVLDKSYREVYSPFVSCDFKKEVYTTDISVSIRVDGLAAQEECPITTKIGTVAAIAIDKWGNADNFTASSKWIDISCGCRMPFS